MKKHPHVSPRLVAMLMVLVLGAALVGCGGEVGVVEDPDPSTATEQQGSTTEAEGEDDASTTDQPAEQPAEQAEQPAEQPAEATPEEQQQMVDEAFVDTAPVDAGQQQIADESAALENGAPAMPVDFQVNAPGYAVQSNDRAAVDHSNSADGYVMVRYLADTGNRIKVLVDGPTTQYQYNIWPGEWVALPLSDGSGSYRIGVYENVRGNSYAESLTAYVDAALRDEYAPFLRSNQYVNIAAAPQTQAKAQEICGYTPAALKKVQLVYDYVVNNMTYDFNKAASVTSGYLPNLDEVLNSRTGICFDYAALMAGMLRSQGVPCKLIVGYAGDTYHAWIDVWSQDNGWINGAIYFDGSAWQRMDPTFASSGGQSSDVMQYIGDGQNYSAKYFY